MKLVFATHNPNKVKEIQTKVGNKHEILSLSDIGFKNEIPEDYDTLRENAHTKANTVFKETGLNCFADDTGLEVDALGGAPGVYSARYAGEPSDSNANIDKLLSALTYKKDRTAQFRTIICLIIDGQCFYFEGIAKGSITMERNGLDGFGYDPVFLPAGYNETFAQMPLSSKNEISHRAIAFKKLLDHLKLK